MLKKITQLNEFTTRYYKKNATNLYVSRYASDDSLAVLIDGDYGREEPISVCLAGYGLTPGFNRFFVKDYSTGVGIAELLEDSNVAMKISEVQIGYGKGWLMEFSFDVESLLSKE